MSAMGFRYLTLETAHVGTGQPLIVRGGPAAGSP